MVFLEARGTTFSGSGVCISREKESYQYSSGDMVGGGNQAESAEIHQENSWVDKKKTVNCCCVVR